MDRHTKSMRLEHGKEYGFSTLKGKALNAANEAGLIPAASSGDGYNIAPFLKFWELFSPALEDAFHDSKVMSEATAALMTTNNTSRRKLSRLSAFFAD